MATVAAWTGQDCAALREAFRETQSEFAARIGVSTRTIKRWEAGGPVGHAARADLDTALAKASPEVAERFAQLREEGDVDRRQLFKAAPIAAGLLTLGLGDTGERASWLLSGAGRADTVSVDVVRSTLYAAMQLDDMLGSPAAQGLVVAQQAVTEAMLRDCSPALRPLVLSLRAEWVGFAGCLAWDAGEPATASRLYHLARDIAHDAEDADLAAYMLTHLAQLAIWERRPRVAVDYAVAARAWAAQSQDRPLRAYVSMRMAEAAAIAGQKRACLDALADADREIVGVEPCHPSASRAYFVGSAMLESYRGGCLTLLGDHRAAAAASRRAIAMMNPTYTRDRAISALELERALIQLGDIDEAAAAVADAADLTARNRSPRLSAAIGSGRRELSPWAGSRAVRELDERLAARDIVVA